MNVPHRREPGAIEGPHSRLHTATAHAFRISEVVGRAGRASLG
jgi:hypothetical protein